MLFSIITCTYNPNPAVFGKLVKAVNALRISTSFAYEWLIIDNGNKSFIDDIPLLKTLSGQKHIFIIKEPKAGLTNARISGVNHSKGSWIIFLDDDNEPAVDYLINVYSLLNNYPTVKCWGPGNVNVFFLDTNVSSWILSRKDMFQEKHIDKIIYSNQQSWCASYPAGTGMAIERNILVSYIDNVEKGVYTLTDRLGRSLSSGGDTQIVFHIVRHGMHVGTSPDLTLNHLIEPRKSTFWYLKKQVYAGHKSFVKAHNEVLLDSQYKLVFNSNLGIAKRIFYWLISNYKQVYKPVSVLEFFGLLGSLNASYFVADRNPPILLRAIVYALVGDK